MTPEQRIARQNAEINQRLKRALLDDELPDVGTIAEDPLFSAVPDQKAFVRNAAVAAWMERQSGQTVIPGSVEWQPAKDALVRSFFRQPGAKGVTDEEVTGLVRTHIKTQMTLADQAFTAAALETPLSEALQTAQDKAGIRAPGRLATKAGEYIADFTKQYQDTQQKLFPYREQINQLTEMGRTAEERIVAGEAPPWEDMANIMLTIPAEDREDVLQAISVQGKREGETAKDAFTRTVLAFDRGLERYVMTAGEGLRDIGFTMLMAGAAAESAEARRFGLNEPGPTSFIRPEAEQQMDFLKRQMRDLSRSSLDPVERVDLFGLPISRSVENLPMTAASFIPFVGPAMMLGSFKAETEYQLRQQYPEMDSATIEGFSMLAAPFQAASEVIGDRLLFGRLPNLSRLIKSPAFRPGTIAGQVIGRLGIGTGIEYSEELFQQAFPQVMVDLAEAMGADIPDVNWGDFWRDWKANQGELIGTIIPLVLLGSGVGQFSDFQNARALARDRDLLVAAGFSAENATKIKEFADAGQWGDAQDLMLKDWKSVNAKGVSVAEVGNEAARKIIADREAARDKVLEKLQQVQNDVGRIAAQGGYSLSKVSGGWQVTTPDSQVTVANAEEATALLQNHYNEQERENILAVAKLADELEQQGDTQRVVLKPGEAVQITWEDNQQAVEVAARMAGLTPEQARRVTFSVLGNNKFEHADGLRRAVSTIFQGGNVLTMVEETVEGRLKRAWENGTITREEATKMVQLAESIVNEGKTGADRQTIFDTQAADQDRALIEAVSYVVNLDVFGRRKEGGRLAPGLITRGLKAAVRMQAPTEALRFQMREAAQGRTAEASQLHSFLSAFRTLFGSVFKASRALKQARAAGKVGEDFDAFINKLIGVQSEVVEQEATIQAAQDFMAEMPGLEGQPYTYSMQLAGMPQSVGSDFFSEAGKFYRVIVGQAAFDDIVESGQVRTNAEDKTKGAASLADKLKARPTAFPSFSKDQASMEYAAENPEHFIVVTADESLAPSKAGRHGKGSTYFPTDAQGNHLKSMSAENAVVYRHDGNGQYSKVYEGANVGQPYETFALKAQQDVNYLSLVQSGDSGTDNLSALIKVAPAAERASVIKQWTQRNPQSAAELQRLVDQAARAAGYNIGPVFHGSPIPQIRQFKIGRANGIYFTEDRDYASGYGPNEYRVRLRMGRMADLRNVESDTLQQLILKFNQNGGWSWNEDAMDERESPDFDPTIDETWELFDAPNLNVAQFLKDEGFDGALLEEREGVESYVVLSPSQIKSADPITYDDAGNVIPLSERFNPERPEITYSLRPSFEDRLTSVFGPLMRDPLVRRELAQRALQKAKSEAAKLAKLKTGNVTPQEQRDRTVAGLRVLNAALAAMPPVVRTRVGGFIAVAQRATAEGMMREVERRIAKLDTELERYLSEEATQEAEDLFDRYKSQRDSGGRKAGKILADATEQIDYALGIYELDDDQQDMTIGGLQKRVDEAENADDLQDAMNKLAIAELFSHWGNMDSEARFAAVDWMRDIIDAGKLGRSIIDEERKQFIAALKEDARESVLGDVRASLAEAENKDNQMDSNAWQTFVRNSKSAGGSLLWTTAHQLELLFGADSRVYSYFTEKIIEAANLSTDIKTDADKRRVAFMQQLFETKSAFKLAQAMARLQKARNSGVFVNVGRVVDKVKIPVDVLERLSDGTVKPEDLGLNDAQAEQALEAFAAAGPMKRQIEIEKVVNAGELVEKFMSEGQGIMWFLWSRQDVSRKQMERDGWTEESFKQLDAFLSDEAKAIADFIAQDLQLAGDMIDPVYRRLFNAPMPRNKNYAPIYRLKPADTAAMDFESGMSSGLDAGFTKARVNNSLPLREMDAFVVFLSHWEHVSHWVSHAELMRDMKSVMFDANVQNSIRVKSGKGALEGINNRLKAIETNGNRAAWDLQSVNKLWSNLTKFRAFKGLAFRVSPVAKQTSAFLNPLLADVPAHAYAVGLANAFGDPVGFASDVFAMWQSPIIQRRLEGGFSPEARIAMGRSGVTASTLITAMQKGMAPMALTDAGWTTLGAAISFRYYKRMALREEGTTEEQANAMAMKRVERMIATSAQPADLVNRALIENSSNPIVKSLWMFASESRKSLAIELMAMRNLAKGKEVGMNVQRILVAHFVQAAVTQLMGSFLMSIMGDDEDKERAWSVDTWALSLALGPINGLFVLGSVIDTAARRAAGMYTFPTELLPGQVYSVTEKAIRNIDDLFQDDPDSVLDEIDKLSSAIGTIMSTVFGPAGGAADVFLNVGRDARKIYKSQAED